jgi:TolB-like protein
MRTPFTRTALFLGMFLFLGAACAPKPCPQVSMPPAEPRAAETIAVAKTPIEPGPTTPTPQQVYRYLPNSFDSLGTEIRLSEISKQVAGKVFYELKEQGEAQLRAGVAVVAAVPLSDLKRESEFGRLMAEYLLTDLADRGLAVVELRLGREIHILPQTGEFILSRNVGELANDWPALEYVVVSTFSNTSKHLIIQGRLVRLKDGHVETAWRHSMPLSRELLALFNEIQRPFTIAVKGIGQ